jgi:hypothetical protein
MSSVRMTVVCDTKGVLRASIRPDAVKTTQGQIYRGAMRGQRPTSSSVRGTKKKTLPIEISFGEKRRNEGKQLKPESHGAANAVAIETLGPWQQL